MDRVGADERGESLIEVLTSVLLTGLVVVGLLGGLLTTMRSVTTHRNVANEELISRNFVEALEEASYIACASPDDYEEPATFEAVEGWELRVVSVAGWKDGTHPAVFDSFDDGCAADSGLQQVSYTVARTGEDPGPVRTTLKRYDGNVDGLIGAPVPGGATRCTITAVEDTTISAAAPDTPAGADENLLLAGRPGSDDEQAVLLRFDLGEGTSCLEGGEIESGLRVRSAALRLFTAEIAGAPDCDVDCAHAIDLVDLNTGAWDESTTWADRPALMGSERTATFSHGTGTGDYVARYQVITSSALTTQAATFYALPSLNNGWQIGRACGDAATTPCEGTFRIRSREWSVPAERPLLSLVFTRSADSARQLRNIGTGACATVADNSSENRAPVVAVPCAGLGNQAWYRKPAGDAVLLEGRNSGGRCIETLSETAPNSRTAMWECKGSENENQRWSIDGALIRYAWSAVSNLCLEVKDGGRAPGTPIVAAPCAPGRTEQQWVVEPLVGVPSPSTPVRIRNVGTNNCVDVQIGSETAPDARTIGFPCLGDLRPQQAFEPAPDGRLVVSSRDKLCLDASGGSPGKVVVLHDCNGQQHQQWFRDGTLLRGVANPSNCLQGGHDLRFLVIAVCDSADPMQEFVFEPVDEEPVVVPVRYVNVEYETCMEPAAGLGSDQPIVGAVCGEDRPLQALIRTRTSADGSGDLRFVADLTRCVQHSSGSGNRLDAKACWSNGHGGTAPAAHQTFTVDGRIRPKSATRCVEGNEGRTILAETCRSDTDAGYRRQLWEERPFEDGSEATSQLRNHATGTCLDIDRNGTDRRQIVAPCAGPSRTSQHVIHVPVGLLRQVSAANACARANGTSSGQQVRSAVDCNSYEATQRWIREEATEVPGGSRFRLDGGSTCLRANGDGEFVTTGACSGAESVWILEAPTDHRDLVQIRSPYANSCMEPLGEIANEVLLGARPCATSRLDQALVQIGNGEIRLAENMDFCLDRRGRDAALIVYTCNGPAANGYGNQRFTVRPDTDPPSIRHSATAQCLEYGNSTGSFRTTGCSSSSVGQELIVEPFGALNSTFVSLALDDDSRTCLDPLTRTGRFARGDQVGVMPCFGAWRTNQRFVMQSNGLVRVADAMHLCLDSNGDETGRRLLIYDCQADNDNQRWAIHEGRLTNMRGGGSTPGRCVRFGMDPDGDVDGSAASMAACSTTSTRQQVRIIEPGSQPRPNTLVRLRHPNPAAGDCLEPDQLHHEDIISEIWAWTYPCSTARELQEWILMDTGQIRARADVNWCLRADAPDRRIKLEGCDMPPADRVRFDIDPTMRPRITVGGQRPCTAWSGNGRYVSLETCDGSSAQRWVMDEVTQ